MKTLKKNNEFKRVKNSSNDDDRKIQELLRSGWEFCTKSEWKSTRVKKEPKKEGDKKRGKNS